MAPGCLDLQTLLSPILHLLRAFITVFLFNPIFLLTTGSPLRLSSVVYITHYVENINPGDDGVTSPIGGLPQQNQPGEKENDGCARTSVAARLQGQSVSEPLKMGSDSTGLYRDFE